jgi:hypothetical protein
LPVGHVPEEPRSFKPTVERVSNFTPVDETNPTLADIAKGLNAVHTCVDGFRSEQMFINIQADHRRKAIDLKLGDLASRQEVDSSRITTLAQMFGAESVEPGEKRPKGHSVATWGGWKILGVMGGSISLLVFVVQIIVAAGPSILAYIMGLHP